MFGWDDHLRLAASSLTEILLSWDLLMTMNSSPIYSSEILKLSFFVTKAENSLYSRKWLPSASAIFTIVSGLMFIHFMYPISCDRFRFARYFWNAWVLGSCRLEGMRFVMNSKNSCFEISPFLSMSKRRKIWRISSLVQRGAMATMNLVNSEKSREPLWLRSILSKIWTGSAFWLLRMATIQSTLRERTSSELLQSMLSTCFSMMAHLRVPSLSLSMYWKMVAASCEVTQGLSSLRKSWKTGRVMRSLEYLSEMRGQSGLWLVRQFCILTSMSLVQASTATSLRPSPTCLCLISGCSNTSAQDILRSSSITRLLRMKSLVFSPILALQGKLTGLWQMALRYSSRLRHGHGAYPKIISYSMSPRLQMSDLAVQGSFLRSWGAMQMGVPQMSVSFLRPRMSALQANPKSATLQWWFLTRVLAGLTSR